MGIEPTQSAWKAEILPLNYTRKHSLHVYRLEYYSSLSNICQEIFLKKLKKITKTELNNKVKLLNHEISVFAEGFLTMLGINLLFLEILLVKKKKAGDWFWQIR